MPHWLAILLVILIALPGALIILGGVIAMFFAPAEYDRRQRWQEERKCRRCGSGEMIEGSNLCPACGKPRVSEEELGAADKRG